MFYTVYKITNNINQKYYIGMHKTKDLADGYMGSGTLIIQAIEKYGEVNFLKEYLHICDNEEEMKAKEAELVIVSERTYNMRAGGEGGFTYINSNEIPKFKGKKHTLESIRKRNETRKERGIINPMVGLDPWNKGKIMSEEYKRQRSEAAKLYHKNKRA